MDHFKMKIHIRKTVNELIFEGYVDELIQLKSVVSLPDDDSPPFDRFGWFYMVSCCTILLIIKILVSWK